MFLSLFSIECNRSQAKLMIVKEMLEEVVDYVNHKQIKAIILVFFLQINFLCVWK